MHIWTLQPVNVSSSLHVLLSLCAICFFFFFFFFIFFSFFLHLRYTKIDYAQFAAHAVSESICETAASSHENKLFKEKLFKAPFILWKGTNLGKVTEINIPTPLGPVCLVCMLVRYFFFNYYYFFYLLIYWIVCVSYILVPLYSCSRGFNSGILTSPVGGSSGCPRAMFLIDKESWSTSALRRSAHWPEGGNWKETRTPSGQAWQVPGPSAPGRGLRSLRNKTQGPGPPRRFPARSPARRSPRALACKSVSRSPVGVDVALRQRRTPSVQIGRGWRRPPTSARPTLLWSCCGRRRGGARRWGRSSVPSRFRWRRRASWSPGLGLWTWWSRCKPAVHPRPPPALCRLFAGLWPPSWFHPEWWRWRSPGNSRRILLPLSFL